MRAALMYGAGSESAVLVQGHAGARRIAPAAKHGFKEVEGDEFAGVADCLVTEALVLPPTTNRMCEPLGGKLAQAGFGT